MYNLDVHNKPSPIIMQRTQIYLTNEQQEGLTRLAKKTSQKKSSLIRLAIDHFLEQEAEKKTDWKQALSNVKGIWSDYETLDEQQNQIRKEFNRYPPKI